MCRTNTGEGWTPSYLIEEGDYLWIEQWSCGCLIKYGIAWVFPTTEDDERPDYKYSVDGQTMGLCWDNIEPHTDRDGRLLIDYWKKIELPTKD